MKIAFYYHITVYEEDGSLFIPGFLGVFLDSLASNVDSLALVMHRAKHNEEKNCDYKLSSKNIIWISLGFKTPAWHREIFHRKILEEKLKLISQYNTLIVRSPTPLAAYFHKYINDNTKLWFMIVGDYVEGAEHLLKSSFRDRLIYLYLLYNDIFFKKRIKKTNVMVNSPALYRKYEPIAKSIHQIRTTTISKKDFFKREDTCIGHYIELLYTGRIDPAKGLFELLEALHILVQRKFHVQLNIVGWENNPEKPVEKKLIEKARQLNVMDCVVFHGKKKIGDELNAMYRMADIYILPSFHEGFPRTIWEAMANSLPVIATKVGGIPEYLTDREDALLIAPHDVHAIVNAIVELMVNQTFRKKIIQQAFQTAKESTLEYQTSKMVALLKVVSP